MSRGWRTLITERDGGRILQMVEGVFYYQSSFMLSLKTEAEIEALHADGVRESLHLEYKASGAVDKADNSKKLEMARDVSAFANADGGQIIYGMTEKDHDPTGLDKGLDPKAYPEIWFEQVLQQHITPTHYGP